MSHSKNSSRWFFAAFFLTLVIAGMVYVVQSRGRNDPQVQESASASAAPPGKKGSYIDQAATKLTKFGVKITAPSQTTASGSTPRSSLADRYSALAAAARAGDSEAARQLNDGTRRCRSVERALRIASRVLDLPDKFDGPTTQIADPDAMLSMLHEQLEYANAAMPSCVGVTANQLDEIPEWTLRAAKAGDENAVQCLVGMDLASMGNFIEHPDWLRQYKDNVLGLAAAGVSSGDWHIVSLLENAYGGDADTLLLGHVISRDPLEQYKYLKLQILGASAKAAETNRLGSRANELMSQLSAAQISAADRWASQTYQQSFSGRTSDDTLNSNSYCADPAAQ